MASAKDFRSSTQSRHPLAPQFVSPKAHYTPLGRLVRDHRPDALRGHFLSAGVIALLSEVRWDFSIFWALGSLCTGYFSTRN